MVDEELHKLGEKTFVFNSLENIVILFLVPAGLFPERWKLPLCQHGVQMANGIRPSMAMAAMAGAVRPNMTTGEINEEEEVAKMLMGLNGNNGHGTTTGMFVYPIASQGDGGQPSQARANDDPFDPKKLEQMSFKDLSNGLKCMWVKGFAFLA